MGPGADSAGPIADIRSRIRRDPMKQTFPQPRPHPPGRRSPLAGRVLAFALAVFLSGSPTRSDDDVLSAWKAQRTATQNWHSQMDSVGDRRLEDLIRLRLDGNMLAFSSPAPSNPKDTPVRTHVEGIPGTGVLYVQRQPGATTVDRFDLGVMDFPAPGRVNSLSVQFNAQAGQLILVQSIRADGATHQVMLDQERRSGSSPGAFVQISVVETATAEGGTRQLNFASTDFLSLLREHPQAVSQYVRPLLRTLDYEHLLAPAPLIAWQVFRETRSIDPAMARRVGEIIPRLNQRDFRARHAAVADLKRLGREAADVVETLDRSPLTPEQNVLLDLFLAPYRPIPEHDVARLRVDPTFLLDCLYYDDPVIRKSAVDRLRTLFRPDLEFDLDAPADVRAAAVAALRKQLTPGK